MRPAKKETIARRPGGEPRGHWQRAARRGCALIFVVAMLLAQGCVFRKAHAAPVMPSAIEEVGGRAPSDSLGTETILVNSELQAATPAEDRREPKATASEDSGSAVLAEGTASFVAEVDEAMGGAQSSSNDIDQVGVQEKTEHEAKLDAIHETHGRNGLDNVWIDDAGQEDETKKRRHKDQQEPNNLASVDEQAQNRQKEPDASARLPLEESTDQQHAEDGQAESPLPPPQYQKEEQQSDIPGQQDGEAERSGAHAEPSKQDLSAIEISMSRDAVGQSQEDNNRAQQEPQQSDKDAMSPSRSLGDESIVAEEQRDAVDVRVRGGFGENTAQNAPVQADEMDTKSPQQPETVPHESAGHIEEANRAEGLQSENEQAQPEEEHANRYDKAAFERDEALRNDIRNVAEGQDEDGRGDQQEKALRVGTDEPRETRAEEPNGPGDLEGNSESRAKAEKAEPLRANYQASPDGHSDAGPHSDESNPGDGLPVSGDLADAQARGGISKEEPVDALTADREDTRAEQQRDGLAPDLHSSKDLRDVAVDDGTQSPGSANSSSGLSDTGAASHVGYSTTHEHTKQRKQPKEVFRTPAVSSARTGSYKFVLILVFLALGGLALKQFQFSKARGSTLQYQEGTGSGSGGQRPNFLSMRRTLMSPTIDRRNS
ncbi:hypothetical protein FVE85_5808 [Porphyridium purpureum]|uniref:Uncharacterized protein n=1 Tax=Porphyridium purpureum TaxID=35688 RepID=A0A5J4Z5V1_PORPP|nr:hypothetical protein FVE85_5808 [Porphyridium purpureum]|eukprot:POR9496..scf295_1